MVQGIALEWNYGDLFDALGDLVPDRTAFIYEDRETKWRDLTRRSNSLARRFLDAGVCTGGKVAIYMANHPAYLESSIAAFKARLIPINVNYRYQGEELQYLLEDCDASIVVYSSEYAIEVAKLKQSLPKVKLYIEVCQAKPWNDFAKPYEVLAETGDTSALGVYRDGDDLFMLYTGGTTGMPKGVMWRQEDRIRVYGSGQEEELTARQFVNLAVVEDPTISLPACPFMHSTGFSTALRALLGGGAVVILPGGRFDPEAVWQHVQAHKVTSISVVGDAIARPLLKTLVDNQYRWDLSSLKLIGSAGVMWSAEVKRGLLEFLPDVLLHDTFGSSEGSNLGFLQMTRDSEEEIETGQFLLGPGCKVFTENHEEIEAGSGQSGLIAKSGRVPIGYYKDAEKSAKTFPVINGVRYSIPGDWCLLEADGRVKLLGRGSGTINTGGEKVFAEEVEEVIKRHNDVDDALVFGEDDERWGQRVVAVVQENVAGALTEKQLAVLVKKTLANYKVPKTIVLTKVGLRFANGKANYDLAKKLIAEC